MFTTHESDAVLDQARSHAQAGAWIAVRGLLTGAVDLAAQRPESVILLAEAQLRTGHPRDARSWLTRTMPSVERAGERSARRRAVNLLGAAHLECGDLADARQAFERAVELARHDGDELLAARAINNLALLRYMAGSEPEALALFQQALALYQRVGHVLGMGECFHNMATAHRALDDLERADECERRASEFARRANNPRLDGMARVGRAEIEMRRGDVRLAAAAAHRAAAVFAAIPDGNLEADARRLAGEACLRVGALGGARLELDQAVALATEHGNVLIEAESRRARARWLRATDDRPGAQQEGERALALFERLGMQKDRAALAAWLRGLGDGAAHDA